MRRSLVLVLLFSCAALAVPVREGPEIRDARTAGVGRLIDDATFVDLSGKPGKLSDYRAAKALVVCFTSFSCPVSQKHLPTLVALEKQYRAKGVPFLMVNTAESADEMKAGLKQHGLGGRYIPDPKGTLAAVLGARSSTETFVLDSARTLHYRGAIDDQFGIGYALPKPRNNYLANAIDAVLAGAPVAVAATTSPGCEIEPPKNSAPAKAVTWHNRVSRIVQNHCQECHRPGETAPFPLLSSEDVRKRSKTIARVVENQSMPPWHADPAHGGPWSNDKSLSESDRADLLAWVRAGAPEGEAKDAPLPKKWQEGWQIGKPDAVFEAPRAVAIRASGTMRYQYVWIPADLDEDKYISAVEVRPSQPQVVHHILVFMVYPKTHPRAAEQPDYKGGLNGYFAGMVPGQWATFFPAGTGKFLPKGATLLFQIHYTPNGTACEDKPKIGIVFSRQKPEHEMVTQAAANKRFLIPPQAPNHEVQAIYTFRDAARLYSFMPHSHVRGKAYKYELLDASGKGTVVLDVPHYDFNWQFEYRLARPIDVAAGSRLKVTAWYDNSKDNPANPDPTKFVRFGEQTSDEMMIGYFTGHKL